MGPVDVDSDSDFYGDDVAVSALQSRAAGSIQPNNEDEDEDTDLDEDEDKDEVQGDDDDDDDDEDADEEEEDYESDEEEEEEEQPSSPSNRLYNPYAGVECARQLDESVKTFLSRLPAATTDVEPGIEWIYICNPYVPRLDKQSAENQLVRGCEDEAPLSSQTELGTFMEGGTERLHILRSFIDQSDAASGPKALIDRELTDARNGAVRDVLALAHMLHVRCGKWMLFAEPADVDKLWEVVAQATADDELGIAAKVAPRERSTPSRARLICIYTYDFLDKDDLGRVLRRMRELGLVSPRRNIYYKCDAYTYLGIASGNPWGIKPTLYSSRDIFALGSR